MHVHRLARHAHPHMYTTPMLTPAIHPSPPIYMFRIHTHAQTPVAGYPAGPQHIEPEFCHGLEEESEDLQCEPLAQSPASPGAVSHKCALHSVSPMLSGRHCVSLLC